MRLSTSPTIDLAEVSSDGKISGAVIKNEHFIGFIYVPFRRPAAPERNNPKLTSNPFDFGRFCKG